jgi:hypothetical protein
MYYGVPGRLLPYHYLYYRTVCTYTSPYMRVRWGSLGPTLIRSIHELARDRARKMYPRRLTQSAQEPARAQRYINSVQSH